MQRYIYILFICFVYKANAQKILVNEYFTTMNSALHEFNQCSYNPLMPPIGIALDYSIKNDSVYFFKGSLDTFLYVHNLKSGVKSKTNFSHFIYTLPSGVQTIDALDLTIENSGLIYMIGRSKSNYNYALFKANTATSKFVEVINFPDTLPVFSTCNYTKNKLIGISAFNDIIEINIQSNTYKILFTLPSKYLGYEFFSIMQDDNCNDNDILLSSIGGLGVFKIDFTNKDLIQVCPTSLTDDGIASPHPYLSCLDLDKNNSTTNLSKDYQNSLCTGSSSVSICDSDIKVKTRPGFADSMRVWISSGIKDIGNEQLTLVGALPTGVSQKTKNGEWWFYFPKDYAEANIENLIKQIRYTNSKATPTLGERQITFYLYTAKVVSDPAVAHIFISKPQTSKQGYSACTGKMLTINGINIKKDTAFCTALKGKEGCDMIYAFHV